MLVRALRSARMPLEHGWKYKLCFKCSPFSVFRVHFQPRRFYDGCTTKGGWIAYRHTDTSRSIIQQMEDSFPTLPMLECIGSQKCLQQSSILIYRCVHEPPFLLHVLLTQETSAYIASWSKNIDKPQKKVV